MTGRRIRIRIIGTRRSMSTGCRSGLARMDGVDFAHLIEDIDGYLCEIGAAQIRDGLHTLGQAPRGRRWRTCYVR